MKYKLIILILFLSHCTQHMGTTNIKTPYYSKGFALIYNENDVLNKTVSKKLDSNFLQLGHHKLRAGSLIKIMNSKSKESLILKNSKRLQYPEFYKILITEAVAEELKLDKDFPFVEIFEVKKNKSFVAAQTKIYKEEKKIHSNAPVETVKIDNISKNKKKKKTKITTDNIYIVIGEFYSEKTALFLKKRITEVLENFDSKKLRIKTKKTNKITLISGPYKSINLMKNDYIQLKNYGFEELDLSINE